MAASAAPPNIVLVIDLMPTLLQAAGVPLPRQQPMPVEGRSLLPVLQGASALDPPREKALFRAHARGRAIRAGNWKLVSADKDPWELYDLVEDGTELNDLAARMPEKVAELEARYIQWNTRTNLSAPRKPKKKKK